MWAQKSANEPSVSACHIGCSKLRGDASLEPFFCPSIEGESAMGFQNAGETCTEEKRLHDCCAVYLFLPYNVFCVNAEDLRLYKDSHMR